MVADSDLPYFRGYATQRSKEFEALPQTIGRTVIPLLRRKVVPAGKRVGVIQLKWPLLKLETF